MCFVPASRSCERICVPVLWCTGDNCATSLRWAYGSDRGLGCLGRVMHQFCVWCTRAAGARWKRRCCDPCGRWRQRLRPCAPALTRSYTRPSNAPASRKFPERSLSICVRPRIQLSSWTVTSTSSGIQRPPQRSRASIRLSSSAFPMQRRSIWRMRSNLARASRMRCTSTCTVK